MAHPSTASWNWLRSSSTLALIGGLTAFGFAATAAQQAPEFKAPAAAHSTRTPAEWQEFLDENCATCHSVRRHSGGLVLADLALKPIGENAEIWEKVIYKLVGGEMPPPSVKRRPDPHDSMAFTAWLTKGLDAFAAANPDPGRPVIRRLTRVEYNNAVRDLLDIDTDVTADLPPDPSAVGFDNNGDALSVSPLMLENYARAARLVTRSAIGDRSFPRTIYSIEAPDRQANWREGLPFGARGGPLVRQYFPLSGEYIIRAAAGSIDHAPIEGQAVFTARVTLSAGLHKIAAVIADENALPEGPIPDIRGAAGGVGGPLDQMGSLGILPVLEIRVDNKLVKRFEVKPPSGDDLQAPGAVVVGAPLIRRIDIDGPVTRGAPSQTASRARILVCKPRSASMESACAGKILASILPRAFRREVSANELKPFVNLYTVARARGDFESAIQESLQAVLVSPNFLFRMERDPQNAKAAIYKISDYELASRLSFFLWSSIPDDRLLQLAKTRRLNDPKVLERETLRMLDDPRANALADNFGMQYLGLQELDSIEADVKVYPTFTKTMREQFAEETRLFLRYIMRTNSSVVDIVGANYTFLNPDLAEHYGVRGVAGRGFRRVTFSQDSLRGGVLGQGSMLLATSHPNVTSPVLRGKWVLSSLLDRAPSPPPPGIPPLKAENHAGKKLTAREQMEQHRTSPVCSSCHARMDPFGFAMENFGVTGVWRERDEAGVVDAAVSLPDGARFSGIAGLRQLLVSRGDDLASAFAAKLLTYALGRRLAASDQALVRTMVRDTKPQNFRFRSMILEVVKSAPFRMRRTEELR